MYLFVLCSMRGVSSIVRVVKDLVPMDLDSYTQLFIEKHFYNPVGSSVQVYVFNGSFFEYLRSYPYIRKSSVPADDNKNNVL